MHSLVHILGRQIIGPGSHSEANVSHQSLGLQLRGRSFLSFDEVSVDVFGDGYAGVAQYLYLRDDVQVRAVGQLSDAPQCRSEH